MLCQRRRRWANNEAALGECLVLAVTPSLVSCTEQKITERSPSARIPYMRYAVCVMRYALCAMRYGMRHV